MQVGLIKDLVIYFLKQGVYNGAGDIAVLCAYLGQLQKVRTALRDIKIAVSVDERDNDQLRQRNGDDEMPDAFEEVPVAKRVRSLFMLKYALHRLFSQVRLGTVDTFQGEEAKIVIISLVRNTGSSEERGGSIGFLKVISLNNWPLPCLYSR